MRILLRTLDPIQLDAGGAPLRGIEKRLDFPSAEPTPQGVMVSWIPSNPIPALRDFSRRRFPSENNANWFSCPTFHRVIQRLTSFSIGPPGIMVFQSLLNPTPAPPGFGAGKILPERNASWFSRLVFQWVTPLLNVGFSRPLEENDLWELPMSKLTSRLADILEINFYSRCAPEKRPLVLRDKLPPADTAVQETSERHNQVENLRAASPCPSIESSQWHGEKNVPNHGRKTLYDESLFKAIHRIFFRRIWAAGILNFCSEILKATSPLLNKVFLDWLAASFVYNRLSDEQKVLGLIKEPPGIGHGLGLAFAIFVMQETISLMNNHSLQCGNVTGMYIKSALIGSIFRKSLRLSGRARLEHSVGKITTMISTDTTQLEKFSIYAHNAWVSPIQLILGFSLLIATLGYSALVGLAVMILGLPLQFVLVAIIFKQRKIGIKLTDSRVRLTTEVLQGIRLLKLYAWEMFYAHQINDLREAEIKTLRISTIAQSGLMCSVAFIPILAAILSFITYGLTGHDLNVGVIFSALQLFNIIRHPLVTLPIILGSIAQTVVSLTRISTFLSAEELAEPYLLDAQLNSAVEVDGDFTWEAVGDLPGNAKFCLDGKGQKGDGGEKEPDEALPKEDAQPFELKDLKFTIPKGAFVAIVGRVGSGKSSVLQSMIGEMRRTRGKVVFGGTVAYAPQVPWICSATLRDNVTFGEVYDEHRFREVMHACSLGPDLEVLPNGELTQIGEKGINLSGGQKARVSLARVVYGQSDIVLLDDPFSALDAYVGKSILEECLLSGPLASRTRVLVTHALHVLDKADYIYVMEHGSIVAEGTYDDLMRRSALFSTLVREYGSQGKKAVNNTRGVASNDVNHKNAGTSSWMQSEERNTGAVSWSTYKRYLELAGGVSWAPVIVILLLLNQVAQVANSMALGFWTGHTIKGYTQGQYMALYAGLGIAQAVLTFAITLAFFLVGLNASLSLFKVALKSVLKSPTNFFDTTPIGRIISRLSKDQETLDNEMAPVVFTFLSTLMSATGTMALVFYTFTLLGIMFAPMIVIYSIAFVYYRRTSVETKRLDSILRSLLYASCSETLTGLATIRAFGRQRRSVINAEEGLDKENRAEYMTITVQRWLAVRLDFFANVLILGIVLFAAGFRHSINPAKVGVVLTYTLGITQVFAEAISYFARNEQNMNAVERLLHYSRLPSEGDATTTRDPPSSWPERGQISFYHVHFSYRNDLPVVLKNLTFVIRPGEKLGIVGRTGSGKSTIFQALFRTTPLTAGKIEIDGCDISRIGTEILRNRLALVPQDSTLFQGTLRDNLDPQRLRTDAELVSILQRAHLLPDSGVVDPAVEAKFSLDSKVGDEGSNYSVGEKQLLALCRALVRNSRIIVLDEATSSVDAETDAKIQKTIHTEFASSTLLCIAHRLNTIASYDRILVMDDGRVAELDTVLNLYDEQSSIFRSLCEEAHLQRDDIVRIRVERGLGDVSS